MNVDTLYLNDCIHHLVLALREETLNRHEKKNKLQNRLKNGEEIDEEEKTFLGTFDKIAEAQNLGIEMLKDVGRIKKDVANFFGKCRPPSNDLLFVET